MWTANGTFKKASLAWMDLGSQPSFDRTSKTPSGLFCSVSLLFILGGCNIMRCNAMQQQASQSQPLLLFGHSIGQSIAVSRQLPQVLRRNGTQQPMSPRPRPRGAPTRLQPPGPRKIKSLSLQETADGHCPTSPVVPSQERTSLL